MVKEQKCPECESAMTRQEGFYALTGVLKQKESVTFNPSFGVPVIVFVCPKCGYIKLYSAIVSGEWGKA